MAYVYGLVRKSDSTIRYIGMTTKSVDERFAAHIRAVRNDKRKRPIYDWWRKYEDIDYVILHSGLTTEEAFEMEKLEISQRSNLLNATGGGDGVVNPSADVRAKQSLARKGKKWSEEAKARARLTRKPLSQETKDKMSATRKGKKLSKEAKEKAKNSYANAPILTCPHCGLQAKRNLAKRWHFDKCKLVTGRTKKPKPEITPEIREARRIYQKQHRAKLRKQKLENMKGKL